MKQLSGKSLPAELLHDHHYVCDLIDIGTPVLCLWTDGRTNWIYQWCDRDETGKERWLLIKLERNTLVSYLRSEVSQRSVILNAPALWVLDISARRSKEGDVSLAKARRKLKWVETDQLQDYLPSEDSKFDPTLTGDLDLTKELSPSRYGLPIDGVWFGQDFQELFKRYQRLYAFYYATGPRFVRTLQNKLREVLRAPFRGGFSRVNLYSRLSVRLPAIHSLRVASLQFASPGEIDFEAIPSIGESINVAVSNYLDNEDALKEVAQRVKKGLKDSGQNKFDSSELPDSALGLTAERLAQFNADCSQLATLIGAQAEVSALREYAPNTVVYCKALLSLLRQIEQLAQFRQRGMISVN